MGYPSIIYGNFGDEKVSQSTKIGNLPLGALMVLPDGRKFRHARASTATALVQGRIYTGTASVGVDDEYNLAATAAVGATSIVVTLSGTSVVKDWYADGYMITASSTGTGAGKVYRVIANNSAANAATMTVSLDSQDGIQEALGGTSPTVGLRANQFRNLIVKTADTIWNAPIAGVAPTAVSAGYYCWIQRSGPVAAIIGGTALIAGEPVVADSADAGYLKNTVACGTAVSQFLNPVGYQMTISVTAEYSQVNLTLE